MQDKWFSFLPRHLTRLAVTLLLCVVVYKASIKLLKLLPLMPWQERLLAAKNPLTGSCQWESSAACPQVDAVVVLGYAVDHDRELPTDPLVERLKKALELCGCGCSAANLSVETQRRPELATVSSPTSQDAKTSASSPATPTSSSSPLRRVQPTPCVVPPLTSTIVVTGGVSVYKRWWMYLLFMEAPRYDHWKSEAEIMARWLRKHADVTPSASSLSGPCNPDRLRIIEEREATSTRTNAENVLSLLAGMYPELRRLVLVTNNFHQHRAEAVFEQVAQEQYPAHNFTFFMAPLESDPTVPQWDFWRELLALGLYKLMRWI